jgi:hypothetical protein
MALISFFIPSIPQSINNLSGSGLGFYGAGGFGAAVGVGTYQGRTFITDSTGAAQGPEGNNVQWAHPSSGILGQAGSALNLRVIPNYQSTLNVRFTHSSAVNVQNVQVQTYDRFSISNAASGVTTQIAEIVHPDNNQNNTGSGSTVWAKFNFTNPGSSMLLSRSPGASGLYAGTQTQVRADVQHDWYLGISASPDSIGSKTQYGLYVYMEYL